MDARAIRLPLRLIDIHYGPDNTDTAGDDFIEWVNSVNDTSAEVSVLFRPDPFRVKAFMVSRSEVSKLWFVRTFLVGWVAGVLYFALTFLAAVLKIPWNPVFGAIGLVLISLVSFGFLSFLVGVFLYQLRHPNRSMQPVAQNGTTIGWIADPVADEQGGEIGRWCPANYSEAIQFLEAALSTPDQERLASVSGVESWIQCYRDESGAIWVRYRADAPFDSDDIVSSNPQP